MAFVEPKIGIIGGTGKMGGWLAGLFQKEGLEVILSGRTTTMSAMDVARQCNVVAVSIPIEKTVDMIREIGPAVPEDCLMMDLTSIKAAPVNAMLKYTRAEVVGIHPLFGPEDAGREGLNVAVCPGRGEEGHKWIRQFFLRHGYNTISVDAKTHDKIMGLVQGANHLSTIALALCIKRSGLRIEDIFRLSTRTFIDRLDRIKLILEQPAGLFSSLLMDNPYAADSIEGYGESVKDLIEITRENRHEEFKALFKELDVIFKKLFQHRR